jgi:hypothetical protein
MPGLVQKLWRVWHDDKEFVQRHVVPWFQIGQGPVDRRAALDRLPMHVDRGVGQIDCPNQFVLAVMQGAASTPYCAAAPSLPGSVAVCIPSTDLATGRYALWEDLSRSSASSASSSTLPSGTPSSVAMATYAAFVSARTLVLNWVSRPVR